jgi:hypothetical protein
MEARLRAAGGRPLRLQRDLLWRLAGPVMGSHLGWMASLLGFPCLFIRMIYGGILSVSEFLITNSNV